MERMFARIGRIAGRQHGVVSRGQAVGCGLTAEMIERLVRDGQWVRVYRGVYRINGAPDTWPSRMMAVCFAAGPGAAISHRSAAALWGLDGFEPRRPVHVSVPASRRPRVPGAVVHRSTDLELAKVTTRQGIPVTGLARTVLDVAATECNPQVALRALDSVRRRPHHLPWRHLWQCLLLHARRGRPGISRFRAILERRDGSEPTDVDFEALVLDLLIDAGLPVPTPRHRVGRYRLDLAYIPWKIGIECKSKGWHLNDQAFEEDAIRENSLQLQGWIIIQVTWARLRDNPGAVVAEVREALARRHAGAAAC